MWFENPLDTNDNNNKKQKRPTKRARLSRWFVSNQKTEEWDGKKLNQLHIAIVLLLFFMYICHIIASPFIKFINDQTVIIIINILETVCLIVAIVLWIQIYRVNSSWTSTKLLFSKDSINTYIYIFWILRSFIIELLKGQILYSFVHVFHSVVIFSTDTWYLCNQKTLILNILLFVLILVYEFFISISPLGPIEPSWEFMNIKTTANSLSRSNQFNLFIIFIDALIIAIYDSQRSKYVMIVKIQKRNMLEMSLDKTKILLKMWTFTGVSCIIATIIYVLQTISILNMSQSLFNIVLAIIYAPGLLCYFGVVYMSSTERYKILWNLLHQRDVVFILILLGILFYIDNIFLYVSTVGILFPVIVISYILLDLIVGYFPRKVSIALLMLIVLLLTFLIFNYTFLKKDCEELKLKWGIFGEMISYCTIKRLIYQSILSLVISAAVATFSGKTDNLFFCNANIYRSTGTIERTNMNADYVRSMEMEQRSFRRTHENVHEQGEEEDGVMVDDV
jgi:hypothetical protein